MVVSCKFTPCDWDHAPVKLEKLSDLILDLNLYPRSNVDSEVIAVYAAKMEAGAEFPAIKVGLLGKEKIIVDGAHRIGARKKLKIDYIDCRELPFNSEAELFAEAVRCNNSHGKPFDSKDLKKSIRQLQRFKFNVKDIQQLLSVSANDIHREFAAPIAVVRTPWGEKRPVDEKAFVSPTPKVPDADNVVDLIKFKNSLQFCISFCDSRKAPVDELVLKQLVPKCQAALGRLKFS